MKTITKASLASVSNKSAHATVLVTKTPNNSSGRKGMSPVYSASPTQSFYNFLVCFPVVIIRTYIYALCYIHIHKPIT